MLELEETKSGLTTIKYNKKYIHSKYYPIRESNQFANGNMELIKNPIIVLYGIGLGYHVEAIVNRMDVNSILYVFEWNEELIKCCKENNDAIFKYENVKIIGNRDEFYTDLSKYLDRAGDIIIHKPSLETIKSTNPDLYNAINDYSLKKESFKSNKELIRLDEENFNHNISQNYNLISEFVKKFKSSTKTWIIASAGPSLDFELELLRDNRGRFNVICVGSALKSLMDREIKPDAIVIVDGSKEVRKQLVGYENEEIPLCFLSRASRWAVDGYKGPKYMFNKNDDDQVILKTGGTVALPAIDLAIKCCAKEIILLGQDLAFFGTESHNKAFESIYGIKDELKYNTKNKSVMGINGEKLNTTQGYLNFKYRIEILIKNEQNVKFINCSKGAFIDGAEHMSFKKYINKIS